MFFTEISKLINGIDLTISIKKQDDQLTVAILPKPRINDSAKDSIKPIILKGTADKLDEHFFTEIKKPLENTSTWSVDMKKFEEHMAQVEAQTQRQKQKEMEITKKKNEISNILKNFDSLLEEKNFKQAEESIRKCLKIDPDSTTAKEKQKELRKLTGEITLFENL